MGVWIVHFVDDFEQYVFSSAEKAYKCIFDGISNDFDEDDGVDRIVDELNDEYHLDPSNFGVEDYAYAEMKIVDAYC